ncbi:A-kinase anchor protein 17A-like isoform X1 [Vespa mandarinia]|uniref:A-kinase anchor protein 17A-like isoform X1 n=2 Tax=Vespa mandarinia TaxID=7446 RepID=UPI0016077214|nr:A-kinase anchor protein 17A-like isoform X1 [Vespa mandarinia]
MSDNKKVGENSSSEVVNQFRSCRDVSDIVPLYTPRALYLKPLAKVNVSVNLPQLKTPGKTISTWEVMEKIRTLILPDEFASLKVAKSTLEFIRLEGDLRDRCRLQRVLARLDSQRLNLAGFPNVLKIRAAEAKDDFPTRHSWDSYFRDAKHMNELKPGERPDTIHISGLPVKWFTEDGGNIPNESLINKIFKKWGPLRRVDVPASDRYRPRMRLGTNIHKFSYEDGIFFDAYIQYIEYMDFVRAMDALRGMKLLKKEGQNALTAVIKVDFDKTKHMSDSSVAHREFERKRLIAQDNLAVEKLRRKEEVEEKRREEQKKKEEADLAAKASRRQKREEKRKRKALTIFRKQEEDKVSMKIAREEQKLIKAQRQLESIRLLDELFDRIKIKVEKNEIKLDQISNSDIKKDDKKNEKINETGAKSESGDEKKNKKMKKLKKKKIKKEKKKKRKHKKDKESGSGSETDGTDVEGTKKKIKSVLTKAITYPPANTGPVVPTAPTLPYPPIYPRFPQHWYYEATLPMMYPPLTRGNGRGSSRFLRGRNRGFLPWRGGGNAHTLRTFNPHLYNEQYYKYFAHLAGQDYHDFESDYERSSRSRSRKRSVTRSKSRSKSRSTTRSRSRSRSRSKSHTKSRSTTRSKSKSRTKSRGRSRSRKRTRSKSRSHSRKRNRRSKSRSKSPSRTRSRSRRSRSRKKFRSRTRSRSRSSASRNRYNRRRRNVRSPSRVKITRAKSRTISPKRRSRSSTWSMPKSLDRRSCSWSKTIDNTNSTGDIQESKEKENKSQDTANKEESRSSHTVTSEK